jgi:hypothetical protein
MEVTKENTFSVLGERKTKMITYSSILECLNYKRVFKIEKLPNGDFDFEECCDNCFGVALTKEEMLGLAEEIKALAES